MKSDNGDSSAFPWVADDDKKEHLEVQWGLSKREWFAGLAMQAFRTGNENGDSDKVAHWAVQDADALIAELEKGK